MKKVADFNQFKALKNMSFNNFNRWVTSLYGSGYQDGYDEAQEDIDGITYDEESLFNLLVSIQGVGVTLANRIVERMVQESEAADKV